MSIELDRRIAEEIMGEPEPNPPEIDDWGGAVLDGISLQGAVGPMFAGPRSPGGNWRVVDRWGTDGYEWQPRPFSTDLDQAMRALIEVLGGDAGFQVEFNLILPEPWLVYNPTPPFGRHRESLQAPGLTLPIAICNLLLALRGEGK